MRPEIVFVGYIIFRVLVIGGCIANILKLWMFFPEYSTVEITVRAVGIIVYPLGAIMGFL